MRSENTRGRKAYFIEFAESVREVAKMPVMVTGKFRSLEEIEDALNSGDHDMIGLGRPLRRLSYRPSFSANSAHLA